MNESLTQRVLMLLDVIEAPVILHSEAAEYPTDELARLRASDVLRPTSRANQIPRPRRFGTGPDVDVYDGPTGQVGVVDDDDYHYEPVPLTDEDTRQYLISLVHLVDEIRKDNNIYGSGFRNDNGLISVGQKSVHGVGVVSVYLSLPNSSEDSVLARCRRLVPIVGERWVGLLTPGPLDISREDIGILTSSSIVPISLMAAAGEGHLAVNWNEAFGCCESADGTHASASSVGPDLERLVQGKAHVDVSTAKRYLNLSGDHVRRLARTGKLVRVGKGRPIKISTESLRAYKGT